MHVDAKAFEIIFLSVADMATIPVKALETRFERVPAIKAVADKVFAIPFLIVPVVVTVAVSVILVVVEDVSAAAVSRRKSLI